MSTLTYYDAKGTSYPVDLSLLNLARVDPAKVARTRSVGDADPTPFWLVWSPDGARPPSYRHDSEASAEAEAERLAGENPGKEFYVLEPRFAVTVGKVHRHRFDPEEVPF